MNFSNKRRLNILKNYVIGWTLAFIFLTIIRGLGTIDLGAVQIELWKGILSAFLIGPIVGSISGVVQILIEEHMYKKIPLQKLLILRFLFSILFVTFIAILVHTLFGNNIGLLDFALANSSIAIYVYIISVDIFMFSLRQVNLFLGSNNLWKLLSGKFYIPREEEMIFMFLDLKSSTNHAEKLGHIQYSKMIQDCFNDLGIVVENEADIYQYVGDEVILTWPLKIGLRNQNCINAYFNFKEQLDKRKDYYLSTYDILPQFKAGVNAGIVTVTEVGKYKKEIAYHGDTINTAARIQGKCSEFNKELLISGSLKEKLNNANITFENLDKIQLRGKKGLVPIFAVDGLSNR
jgi:adenylate cyclase